MKYTMRSHSSLWLAVAVVLGACGASLITRGWDKARKYTGSLFELCVIADVTARRSMLMFLFTDALVFKIGE